MNIKMLLSLALTLMVMVSCKKTDYSNTSSTTQPVFYFNGSINSSPENIQAGVGNYYMNTSYALDGNGVYNYTGEFMQTGSSTTGANSLLISILDYRKYAINPTTIDSLLIPGYFTYATTKGGATHYTVAFPYYFNGADTANHWKFGDGESLSATNPVHAYKHPGIYLATLTSYSSSCYANDTCPIYVGQTGNTFTAPFSCSASGNTLTFGVSTNAISPTYYWEFGDGATSTYPSPSHTYTNAGVYYVRVYVTDINNNTEEYAENAATYGYNGCANGFYQGTETSITNPTNLNDVLIQWYDNTGTLWTSNNNNQHSNSLFKVLTVADYKTNASGEPTKIISATISCELYNSTATDSIPLSGQLVFGVAHL